MLSNRIRGMAINGVGVVSFIGMIGIIFFSAMVSGPYERMAVLLFGFMLSLTSIHITAMDYHCNRNVIAAYYRATVGDFGGVFGLVVVLFFFGLVGAAFTTGDTQLFILISTMTVALLGIVADLVRRFSRYIRSCL